jgi:hypothetical protein
MKIIILTKSDLYNTNVSKNAICFTDFKQSVIKDIERADLALYIDDKHVEIIKSRF